MRFSIEYHSVTPFAPVTFLLTALTLVACLVSTNLSASSQITIPLTNQQLVTARADYQNALNYLNKGQKKSYLRHKKRLEHYPLYPYLLYFEYRRYISNTPKEKIVDFLTQYDDLPISFRLRRHWLRTMAKQGRWKDYVEHFQPTSSSQLNCYLHWAQYKTGDKVNAFDGAKKLWIVGKSQDSACDSLFSAWIKSDSFHPDYAWKRIDLAINNGKAHLAKYLSKHLNKEDRPLVEQWTKVRSNPKRLKKTQNFLPASEKHQDIILYGIKRLLRKDRDLALELLEDYEQAVDFDPEKLKVAQNYVARYLANRYVDNADYWLNLNSFPEDETWLVRKIRFSLRQQNWVSVNHHLSLLPEEEKRKNIWRYWLARSIEGMYQDQAEALILNDLKQPIQPPFNRADSLNTHQEFVSAIYKPSEYEDLLPKQHQYKNLIEAKIIYEDLALNRDFYGFMSSQKLEQGFSLNNEKRLVTDLDLKKIESYLGIQRARELYLLGHPADARNEWYYAVRKLTPKEKSNAARLAELWGWHSRAIVTASGSDQVNDLSLRFPTAFRQAVSYEAAKNSLESDWVFSLIRQESAFTPDAKSPVGALGIMQIMPRTGRAIAKRNGIHFKGEKTLLRPEKNIAMGTLYLAELLDRFDNNMVMATAAYNAGPHRVKQWRPKYNDLPGDIWVETIPFKETRNYVKNILTYQAIYRFQLGKDIRLAEAIKLISPKSNNKFIAFEEVSPTQLDRRTNKATQTSPQPSPAQAPAFAIEAELSIESPPSPEPQILPQAPPVNGEASPSSKKPQESGRSTQIPSKQQAQSQEPSDSSIAEIAQTGTRNNSDLTP